VRHGDYNFRRRNVPHGGIGAAELGVPAMWGSCIAAAESAASSAALVTRGTRAAMNTSHFPF
jgi:hypothetical protein